MGKTKILFTTPELEYPAAGGPYLRIENSIKALCQISELHLISRVPKMRSGGEAAEKYYRSLSYQMTYSPSADPTIRGNLDDDAKYIAGYAQHYGISVIWFGYGNISHGLMRRVRVLLPQAKLICDTDSVWSRFVLRGLPFETLPERRAIIEQQGRQKEMEEADWVNFCDVTTAVSKVDSEYYKSLAKEPRRVKIFANVIDFDNYKQYHQPPEGWRHPNIYFAGYFGPKSPTDQAARWIVSEVLPIVMQSIPEIQFYILGKDSDKTLADIRVPNVHVLGKVPSVLPYLQNADVSVVPLKFESGTRFKILEAAACGIPIVSTTLGAEGLDVRPGEAILVADTSEDFANGIIKLLKEQKYAEQLALQCRQVVQDHYSIDTLVKQAKEILAFISSKESAEVPITLPKGLSKNDGIQKLSSGSDDAGEVLALGTRLFRGVFASHSEKFIKIFEIVSQNNLFDKGIIRTKIVPNPFPNLPYGMVFEHERIPFVSYPHEWSNSMFKDVLVKQLELVIELAQYGLTLKDLHPFNWAFANTEPVFFDFLSIVFHEEIASQYYVKDLRLPAFISESLTLDEYSKAIYFIFETTFEPYFLLPLVLIHQGRGDYARQRLANTMLNASTSAITRNEVFSDSKQLLGYHQFKFKLASLLREPGFEKRAFFSELLAVMKNIAVPAPANDYVAYYKDKQEDFPYEPSSAWKQKQTIVYNAMKKFNPNTVLDIGCNTGWFSHLAAKQGRSVVAFDIESDCIEMLYRQAKKDNLPIVPLAVNINQMMPDLYATPFQRHTLIPGDEPIYQATEKRLHCDMVLALGLIHHMILGDNLSFDEVIKKLATLADKYLVVEFILLHDPMILQNQDEHFFAAYQKNKSQFFWYTPHQFAIELSKIFTIEDICWSVPETRLMFVCKKK